jgi:hypothetical protein
MLFLGGVLFLGCNHASNGYLAKKYGVTLGPGVAPKVLGNKLGFKIDMGEPMKVHTSGSRSLTSPVGSSSSSDKNIVFYEEEKLISINSNGFAIRFVVNWKSAYKHEGSQVTNTVLFYFGQVTQTNFSGLRVMGQYED